MLLMMAELVNVASLIVMLIAICVVIKIYLAMKVACERRAFHVLGPEMGQEQRAFPVQVLGMEEEQRAGDGVAVGRNREIINHRAAGNRARPQENDERLCQVSKTAV